jgi:outer membrane protein assembly factor BamD
MGMSRKTRERHSIRLLALVSLLAGSLMLSSCGRKAAAASADSSAEPDKVLYETAMTEISKGKHEIGRLALQTLMNTYPDSEYLAKAKLGIADSYYKQGGLTGMTQAAAEYEDFITFFPFLDEAAYAQMQVGMSHYRRMEKPDRDRSEALAAEQAFQVLLQKYPDSPIAEEGRQRLREVQEVLAEGEFRTAEFYFIRGADRSALGRLQRLTNHYPLYSQADRAQWNVAQIYERHGGGAETATQYYSRIVRDYPLSPLAAAAKERLVKYGAPVPDADPEAVERMKKEAAIDRRKRGILGRSLGMLKAGPDVSMAARVGDPTMTPFNDEAEGDTTILGIPAANNTVGGATGVTAQTVTPGQK